jgi:hypothetical protein
VPIHGFIKGTDELPIQKCAIFCKFKNIKRLRGGALVYAAQAIPPTCPEAGGFSLNFSPEKLPKLDGCRDRRFNLTKSFQWEGPSGPLLLRAAQSRHGGIS